MALLHLKNLMEGVHNILGNVDISRVMFSNVKEISKVIRWNY
jgi:hypothetical protein